MVILLIYFAAFLGSFVVMMVIFMSMYHLANILGKLTNGKAC